MMTPLSRFYIFVIRNDVWIYILCGLGLFWYLSNLIRARRILRGAMFGLERETGLAVQQSALLFILFFLAIAGFVTYVNVEIAPTIPPELLKPPTPTPNQFATPLSSPTPLGSPEIGRFTPTPPIAPTVTLAGDVVLPTAPVSGGPAGAATADPAQATAGAEATTAPPPPPISAGCSPLINITEPGSASTVNSGFAIFGTALSADFAFYKLEARGPQTNGEWAALLNDTVREPVQEGFLGNANIGQWATGDYDIRLVVVDLTSNEVGQCTVRVTLAR